MPHAQQVTLHGESHWNDDGTVSKVLCTLRRLCALGLSKASVNCQWVGPKQGAIDVMYWEASPPNHR